MGNMVEELKVCLYDAGDGTRLGSIVGDRVYDLNRCGATNYGNKISARASLAKFLAGGSAVLDTVRQVLAGVLPEGATVDLAAERLAHPIHDVRLRAPITPNSKVICMGRTFMSHSVIGRLEPHPKPTPFYKLTQLVVGPPVQGSA